MPDCKSMVSCESPSNCWFAFSCIGSFSLAVLMLVLNYQKPFYLPKVNENNNDCADFDAKTCDNTLVELLKPFQFEVANNKGSCVYSCPFEEELIAMRATLCCFTMVFSAVGFFVLKHLSVVKFYIWQLSLLVITVAFFSLFVLSADATNKGFNFCLNDFVIECTHRGM